jgi:hypothetical protein
MPWGNYCSMWSMEYKQSLPRLAMLHVVNNISNWRFLNLKSSCSPYVWVFRRIKTLRWLTGPGSAPNTFPYAKKFIVIMPCFACRGSIPWVCSVFWLSHGPVSRRCWPIFEQRTIESNIWILTTRILFVTWKSVHESFGAWFQFRSIRRWQCPSIFIRPMGESSWGWVHTRP